MPPAPRFDIAVTPNPTYLGQTVTVRGQSGLQGPQVTIWLPEINLLLPNLDSVLLTSLEIEWQKSVD